MGAYETAGSNLTKASDLDRFSSLIEKEAAVEGMLKEAGFEDCVVSLDGKYASIVVKSDGLTQSQTARIIDILLSQVDILNENIRIFEAK